MPAVGRGHDLARSIALDFPGCIAGWARDRIAFVSDIFIAQLNGGWHGLNYTVRCRFVAGQN